MLKKLKLTNFRNHQNFRLELGKTTVIIGRNGAGKSNVLEALSLISSCRSYREDDKKTLISFDSDFARVEADDFEAFLQKSPSFLFRTKKRGVPKKQSDFIGLLKSVVFAPETIEIICGAPKYRRKFLDMMISQKNHQYLRALMNYEKVRSERNSLLQRISRREAAEEELSFWDGEICNYGRTVIEERIKALEFINGKITDLYQQISGRDNKLELQYLHHDPATLGEELRKARGREIFSGHTIVGPHRDDLIFNLNNVDMANYASRGELRSAILALKICELEYLAEEGEELPLLLLDDVFLEFDAERRGHLVSLIEKYQAVITTTDKEFLSPELKEEAVVVELN